MPTLVRGNSLLVYDKIFSVLSLPSGKPPLLDVFAELVSMLRAVSMKKIKFRNTTPARCSSSLTTEHYNTASETKKLKARRNVVIP